MTDREKAIVMAYTGKCMLTGDKFQIFHKYVEDIMGRPIQTLEMGIWSIADEIKEKSKTDFIALCKDDLPIVTPQPCDVPDINDGDIYECPCGYGWDKSKVVRYRFCPNCGRAIDSSYNSIKPELKLCEDAINRQAALDAMYELCDTGETLKENPWRDNPHIDAVVETIEQLSPVTPQPQPKTGQWIEYDHGLDAKYYQCSICKGFDRGEKGKYCKWCGAKMVETQESEGE